MTVATLPCILNWLAYKPVIFFEPTHVSLAVTSKAAIPPNINVGLSSLRGPS